MCFQVCSMLSYEITFAQDSGTFYTAIKYNHMQIVWSKVDNPSKIAYYCKIPMPSFINF